MPAHRKPLESHVIEGTFRPSRHAGRIEPQRLDPIPHQPPAHLTPDEAGAWIELVGAAPRGLLTAADAALVESAATALAAFRFWSQETRSVDRYTGSQRGGVRLHPAFAELRRARAQLNEALIACGMAPGPRSRLAVLPPDDDTDGQRQTAEWLHRQWPNKYPKPA